MTQSDPGPEGSGGEAPVTTGAAGVPPKPVDLVLEGGGVKGIGLVGAVAVLTENGYQFQRVAGTSAGAIVGALVASGMSATALHDLMASLDYTKFRDETKLDHVPGLGKGLSLWLKHGIYAGDYFHGWIREQLSGLGVTTFAQLYQPDEGSSLPEDQQYKLVVMTSDVTRGNLLRFPWDYPKFNLEPETLAVADAVQGVDVDSVLLPARRAHSARSRTFGARGRRNALELPSRRLRPYRRQTVTLADDRDQALREAEARSGRARRERRHQPRARDARHHAELERPDAPR